MGMIETIPEFMAKLPPGYSAAWTPQPGPQTALLQCPIFEIFYGGARGGGKTDGMLGDWLLHSTTYGELAIGIFFRRELTQLDEVIARAKSLFQPLGAKWNSQQKEMTMPGGGRLKFRYLDKDADAEKYQGHSYTRVYFEEVTNFPMPGPIDKLRATLRSGGPVPVGLRLTGNPGGPGHHWVKSRYIDPAAQGWKIISEMFVNPFTQEEAWIERVFIPSRLTDNALMMKVNPLYVAQLQQSGSAQLVKAWLLGLWDVIDGAYFDVFDHSKHVLDMSWLKMLPPNLTRFRAMDWGSARPFSVGWYAVSDGSFGLPTGALIKYREWYGSTGKPNVGLKMDAKLVARGVISREEGEFIRYGAADPSIFIRDGGESIADMFNSQGCSWVRADNKRIAGWEQIRMRLASDVPMLYFLECCKDTIRTLPLAQHDSVKVEDLDTEGEDHALDETRYAVNSRPFVTDSQSRPENHPPPQIRPTFKQLLEQSIKVNRKQSTW